MKVTPNEDTGVVYYHFDSTAEVYETLDIARSTFWKRSKENDDLAKNKDSFTLGELAILARKDESFVQKLLNAKLSQDGQSLDFMDTIEDVPEEEDNTEQYQLVIAEQNRNIQIMGQQLEIQRQQIEWDKKQLDSLSEALLNSQESSKETIERLEQQLAQESKRVNELLAETNKGFFAKLFGK